MRKEIASKKKGFWPDKRDEKLRKKSGVSKSNYDLIIRHKMNREAINWTKQQQGTERNHKLIIKIKNWKNKCS